MSSIDNSILAYYYGFNEKPMEIKKKCKTSFLLKKDSNFKPEQSAYGSISEVCKNNNCKYIVKLIPFSCKNIYETFLREALIAPIMSKHGIGPKIYEIFTCLNSGYIIMEKWDGTLRDMINDETGELNKKNLTKICNKIDKMHEKGVIHCDLHTANILYRINKKNEYEFSITDYGLSLYYEDKTKIIPNKFITFKIHPNIFYPPFDYYRFNRALEIREDKIFNTFFFNNNYISFEDYIITDKYHNKKEYNYVPFNEYLQSIKLKNKNKNKNKNNFNLSQKYRFFKKNKNNNILN